MLSVVVKTRLWRGNGARTGRETAWKEPALPVDGCSVRVTLCLFQGYIGT